MCAGCVLAFRVRWEWWARLGGVAGITLVTMGSWGDLFPFVGLGRALMARGHEVRVVASPAWEDAVAEAEVRFVGVGRRLGFEEFRQHPEIFRRVPFGLRHVLGRFVFDQIDELTSDLHDVMTGADLVVTHPTHVAAHNVAEHVGVRRLVATVFPGMIPSSRTVPGGTRVGPWPGRTGRVANRMAWRSARAGTAVLFDGPINRHRRRLGLSPVRAALLELPLRAEATIVMASPHVIQPPPDWPDSVTVTSFVAWDGATNRRLDQATQAFLNAGAAPVLVTLGSNGGIAPDDFFDHTARVVLDHGHRALVVTGPGGRLSPLVGPDVHVTEYVPFSQVTDRCRAVVHHAGAGTAVATMRAGIPKSSCPGASTNQTPQHASRLSGSGYRSHGTSATVGSRPALHRLLSDSRFDQQAKALGARVRQEDGAALSAAAIESLLRRRH
jgi:rhamnosyltransferase subunit B